MPSASTVGYTLIRMPKECFKSTMMWYGLAMTLGNATAMVIRMDGLERTVTVISQMKINPKFAPAPERPRSRWRTDSQMVARCHGGTTRG